MIGVLTYNVPHRKTYDTLCLLKSKGYKDVVVFAKPMHYKKKIKPIYEHRPNVLIDINPKELCQNLNYSYYEEDLCDNLLNKQSIVLVCGAGIINQDTVDSYRIINSHPGYIPNSRGLDAFKWAIIKEQPIGVTTHLIGEHIDAGFIIERRKVPVQYNDTFHQLARRVYETEIIMLAEAIDKIEGDHMYIDPSGFSLHKRMPKEIEINLIENFEKIRIEHKERE